MTNKQSQVRHYFIDEGGDSTLFSRDGGVLIGYVIRFFFAKAKECASTLLPDARLINVDSFPTSIAEADHRNRGFRKRDRCL